MKDMITKEYYRRITKILKASLNAGNTIQAISARAVSIIRYGAGIVAWRKNESEAINRKTRKLLTMYGKKFALKRRCRQVVLEEEKWCKGVDKC